MSRACRRFSLRALAIFVTLVCAYFGAWDLTKRHALPTNGREFYEELGFMDVSSPLPFVVCAQEESFVLNGSPGVRTTRHYHLWLFGPTFKLPFETEVP